ncbi:MAG TPA: beta-propeller fold lactonase family protein [Acetobacteraceae bacterium]|nr:beta-propeller fold lactonase family protein [Acetobacteraceae bacterium]
MIRYVLLAAALWLAMARPAGAAPTLRADPAWPLALPAGWVLGEVSGVAVDADDHVWVMHRPPSGDPAPPVIEFDAAGLVVQGWGGKGAGYDWFENEHSIAVDSAGHVWLTGNGAHDGQVLEFTTDGRFVRQIGHPASGAASRDVTRLGRPAGIAVDAAGHEVFVADGYANRRVIVFDTETGAFKRLWGAYGVTPDDAPGAARQFGLPVHCVHLSPDRLVYVCDRQHDRVQIFRRDGSFVAEWRVAPETHGLGSVWDLAFLPDGEGVLLVADGSNERLHVLRRSDGATLAEIGARGADAGQFRWVHAVAVDSHGDVFTGEVKGARVQRWVPSAP